MADRYADLDAGYQKAMKEYNRYHKKRKGFTNAEEVLKVAQTIARFFLESSNEITRKIGIKLGIQLSM